VSQKKAKTPSNLEKFSLFVGELLMIHTCGKENRMWYLTSFLMTCVLAIVTGGAAQASPLNLALADSPDISSAFIGVTYDAGTDQFVASGFAMELDNGGLPNLSIANGLFNISADITSTGSIGSAGGMLSIGGTISSLGFNSGTLLTGVLTAFGFQDGGGDLFEFLFDVTGGDMVTSFGPVVGVILDINHGGAFSGSFDVSFNNSGSGVSDTANPVPEPSTLLLMLSGVGGFAVLRQRMRG
jgi:hypothetical protein